MMPGVEPHAFKQGSAGYYGQPPYAGYTIGELWSSGLLKRTLMDGRCWRRMSFVDIATT
jgi:hypothetical protein